MKTMRYILCSAAGLVLLCSSSLAGQQGGFSGPSGTVGGAAGGKGGGFSGPGPAVSTVEQAKSMRDDANVTLKGSIVQSLGGDHYLFRDATGEIRVDIDHDKWNGQTVTPADTVELRGEVDKDWNSVEIDVDHVSKINK